VRRHGHNLRTEGCAPSVLRIAIRMPQRDGDRRSILIWVLLEASIRPSALPGVRVHGLLSCGSVLASVTSQSTCVKRRPRSACRATAIIIAVLGPRIYLTRTLRTTLAGRSCDPTSRCRDTTPSPESLAALQRSDLSSQLRTARGTKTRRRVDTPFYPRVERRFCDGYIELMDVLLEGGNRRASATIIGPTQYKLIDSCSSDAQLTTLMFF
jgi:hypothetical protein